MSEGGTADRSAEVPWVHEPQTGDEIARERALVAAVAAGNLEATRLFVEHYGPVMRRAIHRAGVYDTDMKDVFQDVFLRLAENGYRRLRQWHGQSSLATYLCVIARNAARDWFRAQRPGIPIDEEEVDNGETGVDPPTLTGPLPMTVYLNELRALIRQCLDRLGERDRTLIALRHFQEHAYAEIARVLALTVNNVGVALLRAEQRLRRCLAGLAPELSWADVWEQGQA